MAVPQLQLANLGEIFAQNQAKQTAMDTMQLEQASALEKMRQDQLARQQQSQLMELARTVDISKPEGAKQAFELGLIDLPTYAGVQKSASDLALAQQKTETARIQGESSLRTAAATERRVNAQVNRYLAQNRIDQEKLNLDRQNAAATERRVNAQINRYLAQNRIDQARLDLDRQNTEREYGLERTETFINTSVNILGLPIKEQEETYNAVKPFIEEIIGEKLPEWKNGGQDAVKAFAAMRKPIEPKKGTRITTSPTGTVVIEEGVSSGGGAQVSPVGATAQQSVVSRNLERLENIATGKEGKVKQFFSTGLPSATGALGSWTPAGAAENLIKNVEANFTIQALQADRKNNPTGGSSFGPLTEKEMEVVRQSVSTLKNSQTEDEFLRNLRDTTDLYYDLTRGNPTEIVNFFLSGKVNLFDAADALKRKNPQNYTLSVPSLDVIQNLPPVLQSAMSGMQVRDQQTGQTITINAPTPSGGGQGGGVQKWGRDANGNPVRVQ